MLRIWTVTTVALFSGCAAPDGKGTTTDSATTTSNGTTSSTSSQSTSSTTWTTTTAGPTEAERCVTPTEADHLYPPWPDVPADCIEDFWGCPLDAGYAEINPTTTCNITEGFDPDGEIQAQFWEAYNYARDYFGDYGPVHVYFMGPTSEESNNDIWRLRAERRAVADACYPVERQVDDFLNEPFSSEELDAANTGEGGYFSISGNSSCNPLMDFIMINPRLDEVRSIAMHEYHHVFQVAHELSHNRESDYGFNSWIMEGQATYSAAKFGDETGWGYPFVELMMGMKEYGGNVSPMGIDEYLAKNPTFDLADERYWTRPDFSAAVVYYQLGAWAWAYLIHDLDGDYDTALKDFIIAVPEMGKEASFELHFGRTIEAFFEEFDVFVQGDDDAWRAILE